MSDQKTFRVWLLAGVASLSVMATGAQADPAKEQELESRIVALERLFGTMQSELATARAENVQLRDAAARAEARATQANSAVEAIRLTPPPPPPPAPAVPDGFRVGNGATTIKMGGFIKTVASFSRWSNGDVAGNALGRDFYLPQQIPVGGVREGVDNDFSDKQTRLWLNFDTAVAGHSLKGYLETDFQTATGTQGSERTTNGYNLALRRAYLQYDRLTIGQDWSTFQNVAALPEATDFVGPTEGTVFVRQPVVRYSMPLSPKATLHMSLENGETASTVLGAPALIENDDDHVPDVAARLNYVTSYGEWTLAGLVRQLAVDVGTAKETRSGYGLSIAGKFFLDKAKRYELRVMANHGSGIGRYLGLNFAPDTVYSSVTGNLEKVDATSGFAALRVNWTPAVRSTFTASYQDVDYSSALAAASLATFNKRSESIAANLFWTPVRGLDLGVEVRHGERTLVNGTSGDLDRIEFAAKYGF